MAGLYVQLDVNYGDDDKILAINAEAEIVYIRSLCLAKRLLSDGFVHQRQVMRLCDGFGTEVNEDWIVGQLVDAGLWVEAPNGWLITGWKKRNKSAEAVRNDTARGNHVRWHENRGQWSEDCEFCNPSGESGGESGAIPHESGATPPESKSKDIVETETEEGTTKKSSARKTKAPATFEITEDLRVWAAARKVQADLIEETERFLDYHRSKGNAFNDWKSAWRNWMSRSKQYAPASPQGQLAADGESYA